jgi:hypothetical protein
MKKLQFYDLRKKKRFESSNYSFVSKRNPRTKKMVYMAKAYHNGNYYYRIVSKNFYMKNK